jgi:hypothetical protein
MNSTMSELRVSPVRHRPMHSSPQTCLALNGVALILAGLLAGAAIPLVPYPRLMLAAHTAGFTHSGLISILAALLLSSGLCSVSRGAARVIIWAHVALWPLSFSEVAAAFWGTTKALRIAGAQAGAAGGAPWQETTVIVCHALPALGLMAAWTILVWGVWVAFRRDRTYFSVV